MRFFFLFFLLLFSLSVAVSVVSAAEFSFGRVELEGIASAQIEGDALTLSGVANGALIVVLSQQILASENTKLDFTIATPLPTAPILRWKIAGVDGFVGQSPLQKSENGYRALLAADPNWIGSIEALALVFPFSIDSLRIASHFLANRAGFSDAIALFLAPEPIKPWTINLLYGAKLFGVSFVKILGFALLSIVLGAALLFFNEKKRLREIALLSIAVLWLLFDLRFNFDLAENARIESEKLERGDFATVQNFFPTLKRVAAVVPHRAGDRLQFFGADWPYRQYAEYALIPTRLTRGTETGATIFVFQKPFSVEGEALRIDGSLVCDRCETVFAESGSALFRRKEFVILNDSVQQGK